jgi:pyruvate dehydrogenase E2 component (dihydrolipoamide acetyltransferase)
VEPGEKVPVGTVLALIRPDPGEERAAELAGRIAEAVPPPARVPTPGRVMTRPSIEVAAGRLRVSPAARQLAQQLHVDLTLVKGSGPDGRIMIRDIEEAAKAAPPARPAAEERQARMRQAIAASMSRSHSEIPHFHITTTIDLTAALDWLQRENAAKPVAERMLYAVLLLKASALAVRRVPEVNAVWAGDHAELKAAVHLGVAIALRGGGLVAPAIHDADKLALPDLMARLRDLVQRSRAGRLRSSEMSDPTITVTNLGETGAENVLGLVYPPQVALVGFGRLIERPLAVEGKVRVRKVVTASLAGDHRALDGYRGSVYLAEVERLLGSPSEL